MIRYLGIHRLAVIDALEVEFRPGLNVLTGETGAGKSIVVGAIGLLTGRARPILTWSGLARRALLCRRSSRHRMARKCRFGATSRDTGAVGRSSMVWLTSNAHLREVTRHLVDLHGQHDHQLLLEPRYQLGLLDHFGELIEQRDAARDAFDAWQHAHGELQRLETASRTTADRREFAQFQLAEIDAAGPVAGEDVELEGTRRKLANAERLHRVTRDAYERLYEGDHAILGELGAVWRSLDELIELDPEFEAHAVARAEVEPRLEDLAFALRSYGADLEVSPAKLEETEARLAILDRLKKKHGGDLSAVLAGQEALRLELGELESSTARLEELACVAAGCRADYVARARVLSTARRAVAPEFGGRLEEILGELAMPEARCEFRFDAIDDESKWQADGVDAGELFLSANPGEAVRPLALVASGGELSRIMLGLKTMAATDEMGRTLVFDEVDAGIGGEVANVVGSRLRELGTRFQVLCITHLPQIASAAGTQFHVSKAVRDGRSVTLVRRLDREERTDEIARMIGGNLSTRELRASARTMLARAGHGDEESAKVKRSLAKAKAKGESVG